MMDLIRIKLSEKCCKIFSSTDIEEDNISEFLFSNFWYLFQMSGCFIKLKPNSIFMFIFYNLFISLVSISALIITFYSLIFQPIDDLTDPVLIFLFGYGMIVSFSLQITFLVCRGECLQLYHILRQLDGLKRVVDIQITRRFELMRKLSVYYWPFLWILCWSLIFLLRPFYQYIINSKPLEVPFPLYIPYDNIFAVLTLYLYEILSAYVITIQLNISMPLFTFAFERSLGELRILITSIEHLEEEALNEFNRNRKLCDIITPKTLKDYYNLYKQPEFLALYSNGLKRIIEHHQHIDKILACCKRISGLSLLIAFSMAPLGIGAAAIFLLMDVDLGLVVVALIFALVEICGVWILCYYGQELNNKSLDMRDKLYNSNWIHCDETIKRTIRIMMIKTLRPMGISAVYFDLKANYTTFTAVMQLSYKFINVLYAFQQKQKNI